LYNFIFFILDKLSEIDDYYVDDEGNKLKENFIDNLSVEKKGAMLSIIEQHKWSLKTIQKRLPGGKYFKDMTYKYRWLKQIENGGTT